MFIVDFSYSYIRGLLLSIKIARSKILGVLILLVITQFVLIQQTWAATPAQTKQLIINQSKLLGVDPAIMLSIAKAESGFRQEARGAGGTVGVFQLMPATARRMGYNPYNIDENIKAGITYYKNAYKMLGSMELAVAAYNAGPDAVKRCGCVPSYSRSFVNRIMADYKQFKNN